jgi:hypothetical protein
MPAHRYLRSSLRGRTDEVTATMTTRREFIELMIHAGTAAAVFRLSESAVAAVSVANSPTEDSGMLDQPTLRILMATAEAVAGMRPLRGHYEAYYRHQASQRAGYLALYGRFSDEVRRHTRSSGCEDFAACDLPERFRILESIRANSGVAPAFEVPVFQETLAVFEATDAWLAMGYVSWEGGPRGLDVYRQPSVS